MKQNRRGFTLIEMFIVVVIIAVLIAVAIPSYEAYQGRSRQGYAKAGLEAVRLLLENYRASEGTYPEGGYDLEELRGWNPDMWKGPGPKSQYEFSLQAGNRDYFLLRAEGNIDDDSAKDIWTIDSIGKLVNVQSDVSVD